MEPGGWCGAVNVGVILVDMAGLILSPQEDILERGLDLSHPGPSQCVGPGLGERRWELGKRF